MRKWILSLFLLPAALVAVADEPYVLTAVVAKPDEARKCAAHILEHAQKLKPDAGPGRLGEVVTRVPPGDKLRELVVLVDKESMPLRIDGCAVFATAPITTGAYIRNSLIVSSSSVRSGSYIEHCIVITPGQVMIGSHSTGNLIEAKQVMVGSHSEGNLYLGTRPLVGSRQNGDRVEKARLASHFRF